MCAGIAILSSEVPADWLPDRAVRARLHRRGESDELRFLWRDKTPMLPVWSEGRMILARWGCQDRRGVLPMTGWTWRATVEEGSWAKWSASEVEIPATYGLENGVWFKIRRGIRGVLVYDQDEQPVVYMICEPATRYYKVMTRSDRMPRLIDEVI